MAASTAIIGLAGCAESLSENVSIEAETPVTDESILVVQNKGFLDTFTLYKSGAGKFEFSDDYGCFDHIVVGDSQRMTVSGGLQMWELPTDGELVVDMKSAVQRTEDPSNEFVVESILRGENACVGDKIRFRFEAPENWLS